MPSPNADIMVARDTIIFVCTPMTAAFAFGEFAPNTQMDATLYLGLTEGR